MKQNYYLLIYIIVCRLSLSSIFNTINPEINQYNTNHLNESTKRTIFENEQQNNNIQELEESVTNMFDRLLDYDDDDDVDDMLYFIQTEKAKLSKEKKRSNQMYKMLSIVELV